MNVAGKLPAVLLWILLLGTVWPAELVRAHVGEPPGVHDLAATWNLDPLLLAGMALSAWLYWRALLSLWKQAGVGRGISRRQAVAFTVGLATLAVALITPLDAMSAALFSAHMAQHMLLILLAAPLLAYGFSPALAVWAMPKSWRQPLGRWWQTQGWLQVIGEMLSSLALAWGLHVLVILAWHVPALYQAALVQEGMHKLEHASFSVTATLFWWPVVQVWRRPGRRDVLPAVLALFTLMLVTGLLGALITFSDVIWYPLNNTGELWGLTPLADQQVAGVLMWIVGGTVYLLAMLALMSRSLQEPAEPAPGWRIPQMETAPSEKGQVG